MIKRIKKTTVISFFLILLFLFSAYTTFDRHVSTSWWKIDYVVHNKQPIIANSNYVDLKEKVESWKGEGRSVYVYCDYDKDPLAQIKFIYYMYPQILDMYYDEDSVSKIKTNKKDVVVSCVESPHFSLKEYTQEMFYNFVVYTKK